VNAPRSARNSFAKSSSIASVYSAEGLTLSFSFFTGALILDRGVNALRMIPRLDEIRERLEPAFPVGVVPDNLELIIARAVWV
jgi:hypothetical protein